jgi:hypothetical protein
MHRSVLLLFTIVACSPGGSSTRSAPVPANAVAADELRRDLFVFAADSFLGRETGTPASLKAARFIAERAVALGLEPAGDSLYYQRVPLVRNVLGSGTRFSVATGSAVVPLSLGADLVPITNLGPGTPLPRRSVDGNVFFAGYGMTSAGRNDFAGLNEPGNVVVMVHDAPATVTDSATRAQLTGQDEISQRIVRALQLGPSAIILLMHGPTAEFYSQASPDLLRSVSAAPGDRTTSDSQRPLPMILIGLAREGSPLLPADWRTNDAPRALPGRRFSGRVELRVEPFTAYNVAAVVRGTDARFNKTYVAYGSHHDHIGIVHGNPSDTIANGADDDGSGTVTMMALARVMKTAPPKRSMLFVWHAGEEKGLLGSAHFANKATVPIDSIVAHINMDMIGRRGGATAKFNSGVEGSTAANKLFVLGPNAAPDNQSKTLGAILDTVNNRQSPPLQLDYAFDSPNHPERYYYRSDHFSYAQKGIPILFFSTGFHEDYHKVSDEPGKIDYDKMARIANLLVDLGRTIADRETRPR